MMDVIEALAEMKEKFEAGFASVNIETPRGFITITITDNDEEEEPKTLVPETVDEVKESLEPPTYNHICKRCGKHFEDYFKTTRVCPDCKRERDRETQQRYRDREKQKAMAKQAAAEIMRLGDES